MIKSAVIYIGKAIKASVVTMATVAFLTSGLLICCMMMSSHANASSKVPSCHVHKADQAKKQESKTCDCCKIVKNGPDQAGKVFELVQNLGKDLKVVLVADFLAAFNHQVVSTRLAYQGPPRANESLPIYLQTSSLRL